MTVLRRYARVWSTDLETSLVMFEAVTGHRKQFRFGFGNVRMALLDGLHITAGPTDELNGLRQVTATLVVDDLDAALAAAAAAGGEVTFGPEQGPVARYAMVRGADGTHVEHSEWTDPELIAALLGAGALR